MTERKDTSNSLILGCTQVLGYDIIEHYINFHIMFWTVLIEIPFPDLVAFSNSNSVIYVLWYAGKYFYYFYWDRVWNWVLLISWNCTSFTRLTLYFIFYNLYSCSSIMNFNNSTIGSNRFQYFWIAHLIQDLFYISNFIIYNLVVVLCTSII